MVRRRLAIVVGAIMLLLLVPVRALAQQPNPPIAEFDFAPHQGQPGTSISVTGRCLFEGGAPGDNADVRLNDLREAKTIARADLRPGADGTLSGTVTVPAATAPGADYQLVGTCALEDQTWGDVTVPFAVLEASAGTTTAPPTTTAPTTSAPTTKLARSGQTTLPLALAGAAMIAGGVLALASGRRRLHRPAGRWNRPRRS